ncbi:hypothetical protein [Adhaeribacter pallidiroseus]|uniref:Uncharacterized protein n=1 Tax=Adhaeribacter pallidiroseus TaxID=2072847 RepID=A0A369QK06_9BACT|nr:hypothetical protein [Adhaeribacter pallidiroseus]RDC65064.1 hypothetical protein AHMF7616_03687 [Adhaeribacter pallidiroseus]
MSAGGIKQFKTGNSAEVRVPAGDFPFDGNRTISRQIPGLAGVNLGTTTVKAFLEKLAFISLPPTISITGSYRINGGTNWVNFGTLERGTLVNEVMLRVAGTVAPNSPAIQDIFVGGGAYPDNFYFTGGRTPVGESYFSPDIPLTTARVFTARAVDKANVASNQAAASWNYGVPNYYGPGSPVGAQIDETFIRSLNRTPINQSLASVTATPGPGEYIYYAAPVSSGIKVFEFLSADQTNPEAALRVKVRTNAEIMNGTPLEEATEHYVVRSLSTGLGGGSPYTFQIGNPG